MTRHDLGPASTWIALAAYDGGGAMSNERIGPEKTVLIWWEEPCSGPYAMPCLDIYDSDVEEHNLRLYQWCPRCLSELSIRLGGEHPDPSERLPARPPLVKA